MGEWSLTLSVPLAELLYRDSSASFATGTWKSVFHPHLPIKDFNYHYATRPTHDSFAEQVNYKVSYKVASILLGLSYLVVPRSGIKTQSHTVLYFRIGSYLKKLHMFLNHQSIKLHELIPKYGGCSILYILYILYSSLVQLLYIHSPHTVQNNRNEWFLNYHNT